jgi:pimeloyl-ACP methyl ester carboxylesterase
MLKKLFHFVVNKEGSVVSTVSGLNARKFRVSYTSSWHEEPGFINTLKVSVDSDQEKKPPLVLLHGYGAALGFYVANLESLARHFEVYAVDLPLFGRSSRHSNLRFTEGFSKKHGREILISWCAENAAKASEYFTDALFEWKKAVGLGNTPVFLAGHSYGGKKLQIMMRNVELMNPGYLAGKFALKYGVSEVDSLLLLDPWGLAERKVNPDAPQSFAYKTISFLSTKISPLSLMRSVPESLGKSLIKRLRGDISQKFVPLMGAESEEIVSEYIYHSNAVHSAGEDAFRVMSLPIAYAKFPLEKELHHLHPDIRLKFL